MANGLYEIQTHMPEVKLIGTVHDEAIGEIDARDTKHIQHVFNQNLCQVPTWATGLPLAAEGWIGKRYKK